MALSSAVTVVSEGKKSENLPLRDLHSACKFAQHCTQLGIGQLALALGFVVPTLDSSFFHDDHFCLLAKADCIIQGVDQRGTLSPS